MSISLGKLENF